jgi:hypothetical protein
LGAKSIRAFGKAARRPPQVIAADLLDYAASVLRSAGYVTADNVALAPQFAVFITQALYCC